MPKREEQDHVLLQTRVIATVGLIALGGGIGLALILARILIYPGLAISLASAGSVFWIYAKYLRRAYRSIGSRIPYKGPPVSELLVASGMAVVLVAVSMSAFSVAFIKEPPAGRAVLEAGGPELVKIPSSSQSGFINISLRNAGTLPADKASILMAGHVSASDMSVANLDDEMNALATALEEVEKDGCLHPQIRPGSAAVITLEDVGPTQWAGLIESMSKPSDMTILVTDAQWNDFQQGMLAIYVLYVAKYEDEAHNGSSYWSARHCMYFRGTTAFSHNCADNRIDLISRSRQ